MAKKQAGEPGWFWRRLVIYGLIVFCCAMLWAMKDAPDTRVNETIAWGIILLLMALSLGYAGLATAQDIAAIVTTRTARPYADPPVDPVPPPLPEGSTVVVNQKPE